MQITELPDAYIPIDRRLAMAEGIELRDYTEGTALFADISGFTPLTEAMATELGPKRGAEEVTKQLNIVYSALIDEVHAYRGTVIGFSGDAITCWFDNDPGCQAVTCAFVMQQAMQQFATVRTPSGTTVSLAIKVAIASGRVRRFRVGDPNIQYIDALAGKTLDRLAGAEHQAGKGEVVASQDVVTALRGIASVCEWRDSDGQPVAVLTDLTQPVPPSPWPVPTRTLTVEETRPWIVPTIYERLISGQGQFLAELRPAVALFIRFSGIDYDGDPDAGKKLDAYVRWIQSVVTRHEGFLVQLTIGDKGSYAYCAFGAPLAHDDDPDRAVATAIELRSPPAALHYIRGMQIGITRGRMRAGPYGSLSRSTYGVMGDSVNLAARLMNRAEPYQILTSDRIADAISSRYNVRFIGPVTVKGKQAPVLVSEILDRKSPTSQGTGLSSQYSEILVGRDAELAWMSQLLETASTGKGQILRLEGTAGVGKSHLAAALASQAIAQCMRVTQGQCEGLADGTTYGPWRQILTSLLGLPEESHTTQNIDEWKSQCIQVVEEFVNQNNTGWKLRLPLMGDLLALPIPDNATTAALDARLRQSALFDLVTEMIQVWAAVQPLVIFIDDAHLMDEASRGLTVAVGRAVYQIPLLLVLIHRPGLTDQPILPELATLSFHSRLDLNELGMSGVEALISARLHGKPDSLVLSLINAETQGNPFFVRELVDALREAGYLLTPEGGSGQWVLSERMFQALQQANCLARVEGQWVLAPDAQLTAVDLGLPDSIQGVVLSRIDRLPEAPKLTLKVASVVGTSFALNVVEQAHPLQPNEQMLLQQAQVLQTREFTHMEGQQRQVYVFNHAVTHDVTYETLLFDQRRQLHKAVSAALERLAPDAIPQLAYHTFHGEDWPRAMTYQLAAGRRAMKLFANHEGIEHLRKALRSAENLPPAETTLQRQQIHATLGELLAITGQYDPALEQLHHALELSTSLQDNDAQAHASRWIAYAHEFRSEYALALDWIQRGLQALGDRETPYTAELLAIAGLIYTRQGNNDKALEQLEACIRIAEKLNETNSLAFAHVSRAIVSFRLGLNANALEHNLKAAQLYEEAGNIHGKAMAYNGLGLVSQVMGRWPESYSYLREAREIFAQTGETMHLIFADNNLGELARNQGRLDEALHYYTEALNSLENMGGSAYVKGVLQMNLGATLVRRHDTTAARLHLQVSQALFASANSRDNLPELNLHLARADSVDGDFSAAAERAKQALEIGREINAQGDIGNILRLLGELAANNTQWEEAEKVLLESFKTLTDAGNEYEAACTQLALAKVYLAQGKQSQGQELLESCLRVFERLDAKPDIDAARALQSPRL